MAGKLESFEPFNLEDLPDEIIHKVVAYMDVMVISVVEFPTEALETCPTQKICYFVNRNCAKLSKTAKT